MAETVGQTAGRGPHWDDSMELTVDANGSIFWLDFCSMHGTLTPVRPALGTRQTRSLKGMFERDKESNAGGETHIPRTKVKQTKQLTYRLVPGVCSAINQSIN